MNVPIQTPAKKLSTDDLGSGSRNPRHSTAAFVLIYVLCAGLFDHFFTSLAIGFMVMIAYQIVYRRNTRVLIFLISGLLSFAAFDYFGGSIIRWQLAKTYRLDTDHRLIPKVLPGINSDGIRCDFEADDFTAEPFNIIFLGDSFTYGLLITDSRDVFANRLESMIANRHPQAAVRTVNFGWKSSSPLLSGRLLKDIGSKYKPDLVILCLDMTDFHDDLRYGYGDPAVGATPLGYLAYKLGALSILSELRNSWHFNTMLNRILKHRPLVPTHHFFITNQPLGSSLEYMADTERNIKEIHRYCRQSLDCDFILICLPRSYQYSDRECPKNWEAHSYTALGPYVNEPFKWIAALSARVDFPCYSLLDDFKRSKVFPLYFEHDPHFNPAGHRLVAESIYRIMKTENYLTDNR